MPRQQSNSFARVQDSTISGSPFPNPIEPNRTHPNPVEPNFFLCVRRSNFAYMKSTPHSNHATTPLSPPHRSAGLRPGASRNSNHANPPLSARQSKLVLARSNLQSNQKIRPVKPGQGWSNLKFFWPYSPAPRAWPIRAKPGCIIQNALLS